MSGAKLTTIVLALTITASSANILPAELGEFVRKGSSPFTPTPADKSLLDEFGLVQSESATYARPSGKKMDVTALRFVYAQSAHAAYLWLRPQSTAPSGLGFTSTRNGVFAELRAAVGGGVTVAEWQNYLFLFRGAVPRQAALDALLETLPAVDPEPIRPGLCCRYFVPSSERHILGPASLARFAPGIPPSAAAFRLGAKGRVADFETPSGKLTLVEFEYPSEDIAQARVAELERLHAGKVSGRKHWAGIILHPVPDQEEAEELLRGIGDSGFDIESVSFDFDDDRWNLESAGSLLLLSAAFGLVFGLLRYFAGRGKKGLDPILSFHHVPSEVRK